jgi:HEPN domain-containing protein
MTKTRSDLVRAWCEKGRRDFITAQNALHDTREMFPDIVCFHARQAAEKYLKAYLVFLKEEFPKTHALEDLVLIASSHDPLSRNFLRWQAISVPMQSKSATRRPHRRPPKMPVKRFMQRK